MKHEIPAFAEAASRRQAKFETNSNDQNSKLKRFSFLKFENLNLEFVSDFDIRISNFLPAELGGIGGKDENGFE